MHSITDLHAHFLWGLDDGAKSERQMLKMLRLSYTQGVRRIAATAHACPGFQKFELEKYCERLKAAQRLCREKGIDIELIPGAEIVYTYQTCAALRDHRVPTLGNTEYALIELWHDIEWKEVYRITDRLHRMGNIPIFAHVERYRCFSWFPRKAMRFRKETDSLLQLNANTILNARSLLGKRFLWRMLDERAIDIVASDMHNTSYRPPNMAEAYEQLTRMVGKRYAKRLTSFEL